MHKRLLLTTLGLGLVAVAGAKPAFAMATQEIKAHIPFQFEVENTVLPPGDYTITPWASTIRPSSCSTAPTTRLRSSS
jgi:hypothetical protein